MSRIKILILVLIIAALSIVFIQNRDPIALKLLCADPSQACLYQTPTLPLAAWITLATLTGAIANLLVQTLNRYGSSDSSRKKALIDDDLYPSDQAWKSEHNRQGKYSETTSFEDSVEDRIPQVKSYETKQKPQNIERSGSTYSYKYREAGDRPKPDQDQTKKKSIESEVDSNITQESDEENWI